MSWETRITGQRASALAANDPGAFSGASTLVLIFVSAREMRRQHPDIPYKKRAIGPP